MGVMREMCALIREGAIVPDPDREVLWVAVGGGREVARRLARAWRPRALLAEELAVIAETAADRDLDAGRLADLVREGVLEVRAGELTYAEEDLDEIPRRTALE